MDDIKLMARKFKLYNEFIDEVFECEDAEVIERINTESENNLEEKIRILKKINASKELSEEEYKILES